MKYTFVLGLAGVAYAVPQSLGNGEYSTTPIGDSTTPSRPFTTPEIPSISITDSSWDSSTTDSAWDSSVTDSSWDTASTSDYGWDSTTSASDTTTKTPCGGGNTPSSTGGWDTYSTPDSTISIPDMETSSDWYSYSVTDSTSIPDIMTSTPLWNNYSTPTAVTVTVTAPCACTCTCGCGDSTTSSIDTWSGYTTTPVTESLWSTYAYDNFTMTTHAPIPTTLPAIATFTGAAAPTVMPQALGAGVALVAAALAL